MACIDTRLFNNFFRDNNNLQESFMDFLEYVYTHDSSMVEKNEDGKIVAVCADIDIETKIVCDIACDGIVFKEKVKFDKCEFKGKVSFKNCTFKKQVIFSNSSFEDNVYFNNSTFEDYADFHECKFEKVACFYGVKFQKVPNLSACYFKEQKAVNLVNIDINSLGFKQVENFIDDNYCKDKAYQEDQSEEKEQKYKLRYAQNAKDSFRIIKDVLIEQNNILEAQEWHKLELYAKEKEFEITSVRKNYKNYPIDENVDKKEYKKISLIRKYLCKIMSKIKNVGKDMQDYTTWVNCVLLQLYRNTSDHHTNFVKILNFTAGMITLYAGLCYAFIKHIDILNSIDFSDFLFLSSYCVIIIILFSYSIVRKKFLMLSLAMFFIIFAFLFFESMTFLNSKPIEVFFLMVYFLGIIIFYIFFICKIKIIIFFVRVLSYMVFLGVIILKPQLINPFIGIFSSDKLFESKFERKLSDLNSSTIINLAKISQKEFTLQDDYNVSFAELNSAKMMILSNKNNITALKDENLTKVAEILGDALYSEISQAIEQDRILGDIIKSTSVIYSIILLLCIFSLQKTARKNSIIPS